MINSFAKGIRKLLSFHKKKLLLQSGKTIKFLNMKITNLSLYFITLLIALGTPILIYFKYGPMPNMSEYLLETVSIILSGISFVVVVWTVAQQQEQSKNQQFEIKQNNHFAKQNYDVQVLNHIQYFISDSMKESRKQCWLLWSKINTTPELSNEIREILYMSLKSWGTEEEAKIMFEKETFKEYASFNEVIRYFYLMSSYSFSPITAKAIHFYYIYYRPLFIYMINLYNEAYNKFRNEGNEGSQDGWVNLVEKMDSIMKDFKLPLK